MSETKQRWLWITFFIGIVVGIISTIFIQYNGGRVKIVFEWLPSIEFDWTGAPHQVPINFGSSPSRRSLGEALRIVAERTQGRGPARVYIDENVFEIEIEKVKVHPPAGAQPSLEIIRQLLASANASDKIYICLVPEGGYRVCAR